MRPLFGLRTLPRRALGSVAIGCGVGVVVRTSVAVGSLVGISVGTSVYWSSHE